MTNVDNLLLRGPPAGDLDRGLDELRYSILTKGIPANSDGMVHPTSTSPQRTHTDPSTPVRTPHLHMAHPPLRSPPPHRRLPRPRPTRRLPRLRQNPQRHLPHARNRPPLPPARHREQPHTRSQRRRLAPTRRPRSPHQRLAITPHPLRSRRRRQPREPAIQRLLRPPNRCLELQGR